MEPLREIFQSHRFRADETHIDLYHVYDNLSRTPYRHSIGIECDDPDDYLMNAWHVITPSAMIGHLDWRNRTRTQFVSFYSSLTNAQREQRRRRNQPYVRDVGPRRSDLIYSMIAVELHMRISQFMPRTVADTMRIPSRPSHC